MNASLSEKARPVCSTIVIIGGGHNQRPFAVLGEDGCQVRCHFADSITAAETLLDTEKVDFMLIAPTGQDQEIFSFARQLLHKNRGTKIFFFGNGDELSAMLRFIEKLQPEELGKLLSSRQAFSTPEELSGCIDASGDTHPAVFFFEGLIGNSPEIQKLKEVVLKIAPTCTTVLIQGESGTGKDVIARAIHFHSARKKEVFMPVDCAAINESVIESELFGHTKGAFTGADWNTLGLIRSSDRGSLFLDEIAELPMHLQAKLLRTLQERAVKPVGSSTIYPVDIRIISASNSNLAEAVKKGTFRQDLYYRMSAVTIYAPPLRERRSDIPLLCSFFIRKLVKEGFPEKRFSSQAMAALSGFDWPGNVRELENVIRCAVTLSQGTIIDQPDLSIPLSGSDDLSVTGCAESSSMAFHEKEAIRKALKKTIGNRRAAAKLLGISEATLYRRIKLYSI
ncbi:sigma54 specific transcriptional regulator, Fis family [Chlorobium phaeobacteroides DSM 266]|uniref:Sigma54 specific transcriptional regulator, Fis family n=1 Tax=Chlorobium phaeobacteroides (strain DSM 266 / SMG 266 / 2430) TaxID=290317 RepID=A1BHH1_CHLPD|nr:sigma54 specific transcriptional regulator, Fis family [Chlorobium phaeobacteroides DSM 266]